MFYTVYKITNLVNGKIYIGVHKTDDLNDDYMGSGKYLKHAQEKYGIENFTREYLHVFDNAEDMFKMESELVNEEFIARDDTYNLKAGGFGGWAYVNAAGLGNRVDTIEATKAWKLKFENDPAFRQQVIENCVKGGLASYAANAIKFPDGTFFNKRHSAETKRKIGEANSKGQLGEKNSQFGTMWITNSESGESKKIKKGDLIPDGWVKGRKQVKKKVISW